MISRTGLHAVRALAQLALLENERFAGAAFLARQTGAPGNYLGKLLQSLAREGLLESRKGLGGGYRLARDPASITLLDIVEPIERTGRWDACFLGRERCADDDPCAVHVRWAALREAYREMLSHTTLSDIVTRESESPET